MAKVTGYATTMDTYVRLSCGHPYVVEETDIMEIHLGTSVDCPVCADIEKRVKAARLEELKRLLAYYPSVIADVVFKAAPDYILDRIAELEAE